MAGELLIRATIYDQRCGHGYVLYLYVTVFDPYDANCVRNSEPVLAAFFSAPEEAQA